MHISLPRLHSTFRLLAGLLPTVGFVSGRALAADPGYGFSQWVGSAGNAGTADGTGTTARFNAPRRIARDDSGNVYVADINNHTIRKISANGAVTTLAGTAGQFGTADGLGAAARFNYPSGIAVDAEGNVYVSDQGNHAIRKITPAGLVTTLAGKAGTWGFADGTGSAARFQNPNGLAVDGVGNVYVADADNNAIRKVSAAGEVTTLAGSGDPAVSGGADGTGRAARFFFPADIAVDYSTGILYVADQRNCTIRKVTPGGIVTTLAGMATLSGSADGTGSAARFGADNNAGTVFGPSGLEVDGSGNLYIADILNDTIRRMTPGRVVTTIGGAVGQAASVDGMGAGARFNHPADVVVDDTGMLLISDSLNHTIRKGVLDSSVAMAPMVMKQPRNGTTTAGGSISLGVGVAANPAAGYQWQRNGTTVSGASTAVLTVSNVQPDSAGLFGALATNSQGQATTRPAIVGVSSSAKVIGAGHEVGSNIFVASNGNTFDQVLLEGTAAAITADFSLNQITRISYVDLDDDIVQVEFSGPGTLSLILENATGPAAPVNYNQAVNYMKGHASIVITGATEQTNVAVFSVGRKTAVNQTIFKDGVNYDGIADIAFIAIMSANGRFGGVRTANANYFASKGLTGVYAPGVIFEGPVFIGNITAFDAATPVIQLGAVNDARITGGDLQQANNAAVQVSGMTKLKFVDGTDSHGKLLPAQSNKAVLKDEGTDVTAQIVVNP